MNLKLIAATLVLGVCFMGNSQVEAANFGAGCGCEQTCGCEDTCGCEKSCCKTKCCKMKYYKKVCRTRTKCVRDCNGCKKKVCVTTVKYRRVMFPCKHCPDDLICACKKPCGHTTCTPICESTCGCEAEPVCGCE